MLDRKEYMLDQAIYHTRGDVIMLSRNISFQIEVNQW